MLLDGYCIKSYQYYIDLYGYFAYAMIMDTVSFDIKLFRLISYYISPPSFLMMIVIAINAVKSEVKIV